MKRILPLLLALLLFAAVGTAAYAEPIQSRAVIGADLTEEQISAVYESFAVKRGTVIELRVNNQEERKYLEGYVDSALIGTRSISCVYVELLPSGSGMNVTTKNITWCTPEMYMSALATAGVSGTAAMTGVYKAYEDMTGKKIDDLAKLISTQELTITGDLANEIGSMDSTSIVNDLKLMLDETKTMSDDQLKATILDIAGEYNVKLSDYQIQQLITLCRSLEKLDGEALRSRVEEVQGTLNKLSDAKTEVSGFIGTVKEVIDSIAGFFERIGKFLGL